MRARHFHLLGPAMTHINARSARVWLLSFSKPGGPTLVAPARALTEAIVTVVMSSYVRAVAAALLAVVSVLLAPASAGSMQQGPGAVPILVYHRFGPVVADSMTVTTAVFEEQLAWLRGHDYQIISLRALVECLGNPAAPIPPRAVAITADDGHKSVYTDMFPLIRRYRFPVTLFIYPSAISNADYALTWDQITEMSRTGLVEVQSHTYWHPNFHRERARRSPDDYRAFVMMQLTGSKQVIARHLGTSVDMLAWPFGIHDRELEQWAALAGYSAAFTLERMAASREANLLALPRYLMTNLDRGARFAAILKVTASGPTEP
jgi:peptidoglycan/xylan/chitin deacetylase (PgdA/CDA1 family)